MVRAATLTIDLVANVAQLRTQFEQAQRQTEAFQRQVTNTFRAIGTGLGAIGIGIGVTALMGQMQKLVDEFGRLKDAADQLGMNTTAFQILRDAAGETGVGVEAFTTAMGRLQRAAAEAADGTKEAVEAFNRLGVRVRDTNGQVRPTADLLLEVADAIARIENPARQTQAAIDIFGRSGAQLLPFLKQGSDGLREFAASAKGIASPETIRAFDDFGDAFDKMMRTIGTAAADVLTPVIRGFNRLVELITEAAERTREAQRTIGRDNPYSVYRPLDAPSTGQPLTPEQQQRLAEIRAGLDAFRDARNPLAPTTTGGAANVARASGGGADGTRDVERSLERIREANRRLVESLRDVADPSREVQRQIAALNAEFDAGNVSVEEYGELFAALKQKIIGVGDAANDAEGPLTQIGAEVLAFGRDISSGIIDSLTGAEASFSDFVTTILRKIAEMVVYLLAVKPILELFFGKGGLFSGLGFSWGDLGIGSGGVKPAALTFGGARAAGGRVSAGQAYRVGEFGPETFLPATAGRIVPAGGGDVTVNVINNTPAAVRTEERAGADGRQIDIYIESAVENAINRGRFDRTLGATYGLGRRGRM